MPNPTTKKTGTCNRFTVLNEVRKIHSRLVRENEHHLRTPQHAQRTEPEGSEGELENSSEVSYDGSA